MKRLVSPHAMPARMLLLSHLASGTGDPVAPSWSINGTRQKPDRKSTNTLIPDFDTFVPPISPISRQSILARLEILGESTTTELQGKEPYTVEAAFLSTLASAPIDIPLHSKTPIPHARGHHPDTTPSPLPQLNANPRPLSPSTPPTARGHPLSRSHTSPRPPKPPPP